MGGRRDTWNSFCSLAERRAQTARGESSKLAAFACPSPVLRLSGSWMTPTPVGFSPPSSHLIENFYIREAFSRLSWHLSNLEVDAFFNQSVHEQRKLQASGWSNSFLIGGSKDMELLYNWNLTNLMVEL